MNTHTLQSNTHQKFLEEGRIDPITGERIQPGDEVVICAACKSAFLKESWEYIGERHCGQSQTIAQLDTGKRLKLEKKNLLGKVIYTSPMARFRQNSLWRGLLAYGGGGIAVLLNVIGTALDGDFGQSNLVFLFITVSFLLFFSGMFWFHRSRTRSSLVIREKGIEVVGTKSPISLYPFTAIQHLHLYMDNDPIEKGSSFNLANIRLQFTLKDGTKLWVNISDSNLDSRKVSRIIFEQHDKVEVSFAVKDPGDYKRLQRLAREAGKEISVRQL